MAVRPSKGTCTFAMGFQIKQGSYGSVSLNGLGFIVLGLTPEAMGNGNWSVGLIIDEQASAEQRDAHHDQHAKPEYYQEIAHYSSTTSMWVLPKDSRSLRLSPSEYLGSLVSITTKAPMGRFCCSTARNCSSLASKRPATILPSTTTSPAKAPLATTSQVELVAEREDEIEETEQALRRYVPVIDREPIVPVGHGHEGVGWPLSGTGDPD
jgi:hypothetical protein